MEIGRPSSCGLVEEIRNARLPKCPTPTLLAAVLVNSERYGPPPARSCFLSALRRSISRCPPVSGVSPPDQERGLRARLWLNRRQLAVAACLCCMHSPSRVRTAPDKLRLLTCPQRPQRRPCAERTRWITPIQLPGRTRVSSSWRSSASFAFSLRSLSGPTRTMIFWPAVSESSAGSANS